MVDYLLVMVGGAIGALCRFIGSSFIKKNVSTEFPLATLLINVVGSFLMGLLIAVHPGNFNQLLLGTGFMGGFTTFSTFEMENVTLFQKKEYMKLGLYVVSSGLLCIVFAILGLQIGHLFLTN